MADLENTENIKLNETDTAETETAEVSGQESEESVVSECNECYELDTSQGDFTTITVGILGALVIYFIVPNIFGFRLGDLPVVVVYLGFVILALAFWQIAEKVKHRNDPKD